MPSRPSGSEAPDVPNRDESDIREEDVWDEHLASVHVGRHWAYLFAVLVGGFVLMVALIAILGG